MIMASQQIFSGKVKYMSGQIKFDLTNVLYIINGNFMEFTKGNECWMNECSPYHKDCECSPYHKDCDTISHV